MKATIVLIIRNEQGDMRDRNKRADSLAEWMRAKWWYCLRYSSDELPDLAEHHRLMRAKRRQCRCYYLYHSNAELPGLDEHSAWFAEKQQQCWCFIHHRTCQYNVQISIRYSHDGSNYRLVVHLWKVGLHQNKALLHSLRRGYDGRLSGRILL